MKIHPQDPRLTAYLLGELDAADAHKIRQAIAADPSLRETLAQIQATQTTITESLSATPALTLLPHQHEAVVQEARKFNRRKSNHKLPQLLTKKQPLHYAIALAAVAALIVLIATFRRSPEPTSTPLAASTPPTPPPSSPATTAPPKNLPTPLPTFTNPSAQRALPALEFPAFALPLTRIESTSTPWDPSLLTRPQTPQKNSLPLETILNTLPLKINAYTAVTRDPKANWHPDLRNSGLTSHAATLGIETLPCPWKPSATLLLVQLRGNATSPSHANLVFHPHPQNVSTFRLLGYSGDTSPTPTQPSTLLEAGGSRILALEIQPANSDAPLGTLSWDINHHPAPTLQILRDHTAEPSDDARFAALLCCFVKWLNQEQATIDRELLAALIRENDSATLPTDRADLLTKIKIALDLR